MPKSKVRKKPEASANRASGVSRTPVVVESPPSPRWYPIAMVAVLVIGLAYIVVYYIVGDRVPYMQSVGSWNLAIGFGILVLGLLMSVRWR